MMGYCEDHPSKPVWFVLDELQSLNKLPQLHPAVTGKPQVWETRRSGLSGAQPERKTLLQPPQSLPPSLRNKMLSGKTRWSGINPKKSIRSEDGVIHLTYKRTRSLFSMSANALVQTRIDPAVKKRAAPVLE